MNNEDEMNQDQPPEAFETGLEERLAETEAALAETKDKLLRALADSENTRKRAQREREEARKYAASSFAKDMLNVADNLRRALSSVAEESEWDEPTRNLLAGVAATERELLAALERHGIRRLDPLGERFDHNFHQAMFEAENTGQPAGTIIQVLQPGYTIHDRLLRPAMVAVAKGAAPD
ncbi:MAG TPA: nucleotide exchange factor GrpE [Stellaceae bacterium]|jgi:molecular chaperone GrpE|nr:nucleotide exchange factor GrpE [Stellaceae bacterium]